MNSDRTYGTRADDTNGGAPRTTLRNVLRFFFWRELRRPVLWLTAAGLLALTALVVLLGLRDFAARRAQYERVLQQLIQDQVRPSPGFTGRLVEPALRALRPPEAATVVARGIDALIPAYADFGPAGRVPGPANWTQGLDTGAGPPLDVEFIVRVICGLLAISLAVRTTASDRSAGLTRALSGLPARPSTLLLGSLAANAVILLIGLVACLAVTMAVVSLRAPEVAGEIRAAVFAAMPLASAYLLFLLTLGALIGTLVRREAAAYGASFAAWFAVVLLAPQLLTLAIGIVIPLPSQSAMLAERDEVFADRIREGENALGDAVGRFAPARTTQAFSATIDAHAAQLDAEWLRSAAAAREDAQGVEFAWTERLLLRQRAMRWGDWFSPASEFSDAMANLSHTGTLVAHEWDRNTSAYQSALEYALFDDRPNAAIHATTDDGPELFVLHRHLSPKLATLPQFRLPAQHDPVRESLIWTIGRLLLGSIVTLVLTVWVSQRRGLGGPELP